MRNAIRTALLGLFGVVTAGFAQAHTHEYGGWIIDRCAALTGVGVRHHVCKTCGEGEGEFFYGERRRLKVSILGDSYSTYKGWNPEGAKLWYGDPSRSTYNQTDVHDVTNTWWHLLITKLGAELCVNNSYSGAPISDRGYSGADAQDFSFINRACDLGDSPDLIVVLGATNDAWAGVPMGSDDDSTATRPIRTFIPAVKRMCDEVDQAYPNAQKIMVYNEFLKEYDRLNYITAMKPIVASHGWKSCGVNIKSGASNGHPTCAGMRMIAEAVETEFNRSTEWTQRVESTKLPTYMQGRAEDVVAKYTAWAAKHGADAASAHETAFLLDCGTTTADIAAAKAAFEITRITYDETTRTWACEVAGAVGEGEAYGNGYVHFVSVKESFAGAGTGADFFKATLEYLPVGK